MPGNDKPPQGGSGGPQGGQAGQGGATNIQKSGRARTVRIRSGERTSVWNDVDVELDPQTGIIQLSHGNQLVATAHISSAIIFWDTEPPKP